MKKYRILYWLGCMTTDFYVYADCIEMAVKRFVEVKGRKTTDIIRVEEV